MKKNIIFYIFVAIIALIIIFISTYLSQTACLFSDDLWYGLYDKHEGFFDCLFKHTAYEIHGGGYLCLFLTQILNFKLPVLFGIHPMDFNSTYVGIFKGIVYTTVFLMIAKYTTFWIKSRKILFSVFFFISAFYLYSLYIAFPMLFTLNFTFFRYIVPIIFFSIFLEFIWKNSLGKIKSISKKHLVFLLLCCYILETSIEVLIYVSVCLLGLMCVYNVCAKFISQNNDKLKKSLIFNLDKNYYIIMGFSYINMIIYHCSWGYVKTLKQRNFENFYLPMSDVRDFFIQYWKEYVLDIIWIWIAFITFMGFAFYFAFKRNEIKQVVIPFFLQFSIVLVYCSLVICGRTHYDTNGFWLSSTEVKNLYYIIILYALCMYFGYVIKQVRRIIPTIIEKKIFINLICIFICTITIIFTASFAKDMTNCIQYYVKNTHYIEMVRTRLYMAEKMMRFYYLKGEIPYIPVEFNDITDKENCSLYVWKNRFEDYKQNPCKTGGAFSTLYYPRIYNDKTSIEKGFCFSNDAMEKFTNEGGNFSQEELKKLRFQRLLDDNFVLNKKE